MTEQILSTLKQKISGFELQPSQGGCFEVTVNDQLIYSKLDTGEFPEEAAIIAQIESLA